MCSIKVKLKTNIQTDQHTITVCCSNSLLPAVVNTFADVFETEMLASHNTQANGITTFTFNTYNQQKVELLKIWVVKLIVPTATFEKFNLN